MELFEYQKKLIVHEMPNPTTGAVAATSHNRQTSSYSSGHFNCRTNATNISDCGQLVDASCEGDAGAGVICQGRDDILLFLLMQMTESIILINASHQFQTLMRQFS